jgi:hypothetical protein
MIDKTCHKKIINRNWPLSLWLKGFHITNEKVQIIKAHQIFIE